VVAEFTFCEWTAERLLRHARYVDLLPDVEPGVDVVYQECPRCIGRAREGTCIACGGDGLLQPAVVSE
jgi:hypothetical protein